MEKMFFKTVVTIFLISLISQQTNANIDVEVLKEDQTEVMQKALNLFFLVKNLSKNNQSVSVIQYQGIIDTAKQLLELLKKIAVKFINKFKTQLEPIVQKIKDFAISIANKTKTSIKRQLMSFQNIFNDIKIFVNNSDSNFTLCLEEGETNFKKLSLSLYEELHDCISEDINKTLEIIDDSRTRINNTYNRISVLFQELETCNASWFDFTCTAIIVAKVLYASVQLPIGLSRTVNDLYALISSSKSRVKSCATARVSECVDNGKQYLNDFGTCVFNIIAY